MKIAYLSTSILPSTSANSLHVMKMCQAFSENGHEVILFAPNIGPEYKGSIHEFYGVKKNFKIKKISTPNIKGKNYLYAFKSAKEAKKYKVDLCYGRFIGSCYFSQMLGLPTIYEAHGEVRNKRESYMFNKIIHSKKFIKFISMSEYLKGKYKRKFDINEEDIIVAYNGADKTDKLKRVQFNKPEKIHVGYIGNLYEGKGMEIVGELINQVKDCHFHIIGGNETDVRKWENKLSESKNITFYGFMQHSDTIEYRNSLDVLLCPTKSNVSVFGGKSKSFNQKNSPPIKIFEYMESGKAIIASDFLYEVLENDRNALLCPEDDIKKWIESLQFLVDNEEYRLSIGREAEKDFNNNYTWYKRAQRVIEL